MQPIHPENCSVQMCMRFQEHTYSVFVWCVWLHYADI